MKLDEIWEMGGFCSLFFDIESDGSKIPFFKGYFYGLSTTAQQIDSWHDLCVYLLNHALTCSGLCETHALNPNILCHPPAIIHQYSSVKAELNDRHASLIDEND